MALLERWQRLSPPQQRVAAIVSVVAGAWLIDAVGLAPLRRQIRALREEVRATEEQLIRAVSINLQATSIRTAFEAYRGYVPSTPTTQVPSDVQSEVETAVRSSGVNLLNVKPSSSSDTTVSVALELETSPDQLIRLLDSLQRSPQLLKVTQLALRVADERAASLRCSMVISKLLLPAPTELSP